MSKFKVGDKVRVVAKPSRGLSNEGYFRVGEEFTVKEVFDRQDTVSLVGKGSCWDESRFELVEEVKPTPSEPSSTSFKVGDKVRRKPDSYCYGWDLKDVVCTITNIYVRNDGTQSLTLKGVKDFGWDESRFELVEEVKPTAPVVSQLPGIPEGFRAVRIGTPAKGEWYISGDDEVQLGDGWQTAGGYVILEKIDQPAPVEPPKPVEPVKKVAPTFKVGDKVRLVDNRNGYEKFPIGAEATVFRVCPNNIPSEGDLLLLDGALDSAHSMFAYRFELVTESPDDLVIQDRVPARAGIDFGWWVSPEQFDSFVPNFYTKWDVGVDSNALKERHGFAMPGGDRLFVTCYRKDLPVPPITEKVVIDEYVVWDTDGPKCLLWSDTNPTIENDSYGAWDHAYPTGNTREIEVPIVKP